LGLPWRNPTNLTGLLAYCFATLGDGASTQPKKLNDGKKLFIFSLFLGK